MITTKREISIFEGIRALIPDAKLYVEDNSWEKIHWDDEREQPFRSDIEAKIKELQAESDAKEYQRKRLQEYPSIQECIHAILDNDLEALQEKRTAVKAKYPKPE